MGVITFDGISSSSLGVTVEGYSSAPMAEKDVEKVHVPGRSGDLIIDNGSFLNYNQKYTMHWLKNNHNRTAITSWLYKDGYKKFVDDYDNEHFRMAHFVGGVPIDSRMDVLDRAVFEFDFKPQRFLTSGETPLVFEEYGLQDIENPTMFEARPLLRVYGSGWIRFTSGSIITISEPGNQYIDIDCESMQCYEGEENRNANVTVKYGFPVLLPGTTSFLRQTTVTRVDVIPRWWEI